MLHHAANPLIEGRAGPRADDVSPRMIDIGTTIRRYRWTLIGCIAVSVAIAIAYLSWATPLYTARSQIMIDPKMPQMPAREQGGDLATSMDAALIESQMVVMRSEKIATAVIDTLGLEDVPDGPPGLVGRIRDRFPWLFPPPAPPSPFIRARRVIATMEAGLAIRRIGTSYAFEIAFSDPDADRAARIVNATADAYVRDQLDSRSESARQGSEWLEGRIQQLRRQMNVASKLVQEFRASHDYRIHGRRTGTADPGPNAAATADEPITLEELETAAQTARKIYESYLQAFAEAVQRQSFPLAGARVLALATRPISPSHPRSALVLALAVLLGGMAGTVIVIVRQSRDTGIRSVQQLRFLGRTAAAVAVPRIRSVAGEPRPVRASRKKAGGALIEASVAPLSAFSDELRRLKTFLSRPDSSQPVRMIGIVSACPGDGKSTIASNLAALFQSSGARTLLIDADLRNASLSRHLAAQAAHGLLDVLSGREPLEGAVHRAEPAGFDLLPTTSRLPIAHASDLLGSDRMRGALGEALTLYDTVLVDLPPTSVVADALVVGPLLDGVVVVARWGETPAAALDDLISSLDGLQVRILAAVLTQHEIRGGRAAVAA